MAPAEKKSVGITNVTGISRIPGSGRDVSPVTRPYSVSPSPAQSFSRQSLTICGTAAQHLCSRRAHRSPFPTQTLLSSLTAKRAGFTGVTCSTTGVFEVLTVTFISIWFPSVAIPLFLKPFSLLSNRSDPDETLNLPWVLYNCTIAPMN